jgi:ankyrin repeat protein
MIRPRELESGRGRDAWEVIHAAATGDTAMLRSLLARDPTLIDSEYFYAPSIHFAVREGHLDAVRILLEAGADPERNGDHDGSLIEMARERGYDAIAQLLDEARRHRARTAPAEARSDHPIHLAAEADDVERVRELLDGDPTLLQRRDSVGDTPLDRAVMGSARGVIALLLARGANYDLTLAAALGDVDRVTALLDEDPNRIREAPPNGRRALSAAVQFGHGSLARLLLERGADPTWPEKDANKGAALHAAARAGDRELVELLLAHGADPNGHVDCGGNAVFAAKTPELRALLMARGGTLDPYDLVWLDEDDEVIRRVTEDPTSAELGCGGVFTAVCTRGKRDLLVRLLDAGIRVPAVVTGCRSYLLENVEMLRMLLASGMSPDLPDWQGQTFLHGLCSGSKRCQPGEAVERAGILLDAGASITAREDQYRSTPLAWAARTNMPDMVEFLLTRGAPPHLPDDPPWATPLAWAERRGHVEIAEMLQRALDGGA